MNGVVAEGVAAEC
jgi:hypothetical protein